MPTRRHWIARAASGLAALALAPTLARAQFPSLPGFNRINLKLSAFTITYPPGFRSLFELKAGEGLVIAAVANPPDNRISFPARESSPWMRADTQHIFVKLWLIANDTHTRLEDGEHAIPLTGSKDVRIFDRRAGGGASKPVVHFRIASTYTPTPSNPTTVGNLVLNISVF